MTDLTRRGFIGLSSIAMLPSTQRPKIWKGRRPRQPRGEGEADYVIDAAAPMGSPDRGLESFGRFLDRARLAGVTGAFVPVATVEHLEDASRNLLALRAFCRQLEDRAIWVRSVDDLTLARGDGRIGVVPHFQGLQMVEEDIETIAGFKSLGVGVMAVTHSWKNWNGDGCLERTDLPLTGLGVMAVETMTAARVVLDLSHAGVRTSLHAIEVARAPVLFTHSNVRAVHGHPRNLTTEQIDACAAAGGVIALNAFPAFVSESDRPTLAEFLRHADFLFDRVGVDHVAIGLDFSDRRHVRFESDQIPAPPYTYPAGLQSYDDLRGLRGSLESKGLSTDEIAAVMGGNIVRVLREVWES